MLYLAGAFLPAAIIFALTMHDRLHAQSNHAQEDRVQWAQTYEQLIVQRLTLSQTALHSIASVEAGSRNVDSILPPLLDDATLISADGAARAISGKVINPISLDPSRQADLNNSLTVVHIPAQESEPSNLILAKRVENANGAEVLLSSMALRSLLPNLPAEHMEYCVLIGSQPLICPNGLTSAAQESVQAALQSPKPPTAQWQGADTQYSAHVHRLEFAPPLAGAPWTIVVYKADLPFLSYVRDATGTVLIAASLTFLLAIGLSMLHIRRTLLPLTQLLDATERVAQQDFSQVVPTQSQDELGELARSFNSMSARLSHSFRTMKLLSELDRLILSGVDIDRICTQMLVQLPDVISLRAVALVVSDPTSGRIGRTYWKHADTEGGVQCARLTSAVQPSVAPGTQINASFMKRRIGEIGLLDHFMLPQQLKMSFLPIQTEDGLSGMIVLGRDPDKVWDKADDISASDIADRIGVAIAAMQKEQQLFLQTRFDHLTRLPNRLLFSDRLVQDMARAQRNGHMLALLYIDLDFFKQVNDTLGHGAGDQVLRTVAARLRDSVRDSDTVARLSGDEFAVILTEITQVRDAGLLARNIIQRLSEPFDVETQQCFLCASIGITLYPSDGKEPESLLRNADIAMYRAKEAGKGRYVFYEERMNRETHNLANLDRELRVAVENNQFVLHFQPQIDLETGEISGAEALLRWQHPERGLLSPAYFMSHAESSGLVEPLGELVLVKACEHYNRWRMQGAQPRRIAINASPRQFKRPDFYQFVENTLKATGIPPQALEIEITESVLVDESELPRATISKLAALGVRIAIDDFGTGYSSLSYLKRLPFHVLKIDRSFVRDVHRDEDARTIAATVIAMAHSLRKETVAEGVDHIDQLAFLRSEHCDHVQGYLISPPLADEQFVRFMRSYKPDAFDTLAAANSAVAAQTDANASEQDLETTS